MKTTSSLLSTALAGLMLFGINGCTFSESVSMSVADGITATGKNISCNEVYISSGSTKIKRREFIYGERIQLHLEGIEGLEHTGKEVHPGMEITILNEKGEKVLYNKDLYADFTGKILEEDLDLFSTINIGRPIVEKGRYTAKIHLWDKKGKGTFDVEFSFTVTENKNLKNTASSALSYDRIYLFDQQGDSSLTCNTISPGQRAYIIIEGLKGFSEKEGKCLVGISLKIVDSRNQVLMDEEDFIGDQLVPPSDIESQASANFVLDNGQYGNPITVEMRVYDKLSDAELKSTFKVQLKH